MGFKCPNCKKDFGLDKFALQVHLETENGECAAYAQAELNLIAVKFGLKQSKSIGTETIQRKKKEPYRFISENHHFEKINIVSNDDGSDNVKCKNCGLKAKRFFNTYIFDGRISAKKIENCASFLQ